MYVPFEIQENRFVNLARVSNISVDFDRVCFNMDHATEVFVNNEKQHKLAYIYANTDDPIDMLDAIMAKAKKLNFIRHNDSIINLDNVSSWYANFKKLNIVFNMSTAIDHNSGFTTDYRYFYFDNEAEMQKIVDQLTKQLIFKGKQFKIY